MASATGVGMWAILFAATRTLRREPASPSGAARLLGHARGGRRRVAAIERFMRDTAPPVATEPAGPGPWVRAALLEGVDREPVARLGLDDLPRAPCQTRPLQLR